MHEPVVPQLFVVHKGWSGIYKITARCGEPSCPHIPIVCVFIAIRSQRTNKEASLFVCASYTVHRSLILRSGLPPRTRAFVSALPDIA